MLNPRHTLYRLSTARASTFTWCRVSVAWQPVGPSEGCWVAKLMAAAVAVAEQGRVQLLRGVVGLSTRHGGNTLPSAHPLPAPTAAKAVAVTLRVHSEHLVGRHLQQLQKQHQPSSPVRLCWCATLIRHRKYSHQPSRDASD